MLEEEWKEVYLHFVVEAAAKTADSAVYEAMRSGEFDPTIPDNVAEFVGNAVRASFPFKNAERTNDHVNGGAYRRISAEEWRSIGGNANKFCDWHEGIGYVVYDNQALEEYRAKTGALEGDEA